MPADPRRHDRNTAAALLCAGAEVAFVVLIFLPAIVYFFNAAFVEYPLLDHYAFGLPLALLIALCPPALRLIPRAPRRMLLAGADSSSSMSSSPPSSSRPGPRPWTETSSLPRH